VRAEYEGYARNALVQLRRIAKLPDREYTCAIPDDRRWLMAHTKAIESSGRRRPNHYVMTDATAFREGVAACSPKVSGSRGEGDRRGAVVETTACTSTRARDELVGAVDRLRPSYTGFVHAARTIADASENHDDEISYPLDPTTQTARYSAATRHLRSEERRVFNRGERKTKENLALRSQRSLPVCLALRSRRRPSHAARRAPAEDRAPATAQRSRHSPHGHAQLAIRRRRGCGPRAGRIERPALIPGRDAFPPACTARDPDRAANAIGQAAQGWRAITGTGRALDAAAKRLTAV